MDAEQSVPGAFGSGEIKFVCDRKVTNVQLPGSVSLQANDAATMLRESKRLPELNGAPVAAWTLARLAALAGARFPFTYGQIVGSDGDDFWIMALAFSSVRAIKPIGSISLLGSRTYVKLWINVIAPYTPEQVRDAFVSYLLDAPKDLRRATVTVVYTSVDDPNHGKHVPYTLGWDGSSFVFREAPERAIFPEDLDEIAP